MTSFLQNKKIGNKKKRRLGIFFPCCINGFYPDDHDEIDKVRFEDGLSDTLAVFQHILEKAS